MQSQSLPLEWTERIFQKLALVYGRDFLSRWEGQDLDQVKADWAHELGGFIRSPEAIKYALQNLPDKPPTVLQFRDIARKSPIKAPPMLPPPKPDSQKQREAIAALKRLQQKMRITP